MINIAAFQQLKQSQYQPNHRAH